MVDLTQAEIIEQGLDAKFLLDSEPFQRTFKQYKDELASALFNTHPKNNRERETFYHLHAALTDIEAHFAQLAQAAEMIVQADEEENKDNG